MIPMELKNPQKPSDLCLKFVEGLSIKELVRYAEMLEDPHPEDGHGPIPGCFVESLSEIEDWLHKIWVAEEAETDDHLVPAISFREWLGHMSEDAHYRWHLHARFLLNETEPQLSL